LIHLIRTGRFQVDSIVSEGACQNRTSPRLVADFVTAP
jgi:hypothetical protein